jgi:hypothetical protein
MSLAPPSSDIPLESVFFSSQRAHFSYSSRLATRGEEGAARRGAEGSGGRPALCLPRRLAISSCSESEPYICGCVDDEARRMHPYLWEGCALEQAPPWAVLFLRLGGRTTLFEAMHATIIIITTTITTIRVHGYLAELGVLQGGGAAPTPREPPIGARLRCRVPSHSTAIDGLALSVSTCMNCYSPHQV